MTQNKRIIAVTGGIGSGKSTVCACLKKYGEVLSCDEINTGLLSDPTYLSALCDIFPESFPNGVFDRKTMAKLIFNDEKKKEKLNAFSHPRIMKILEERIENSTNKIIFVEVPLLYGAFAKMFDEVILVTADREIRTERVARRDGIDKAFALKKILGQQPPSDINGKIYYIDNSADLPSLEEEVKKLITQMNI